MLNSHNHVFEHYEPESRIPSRSIAKVFASRIYDGVLRSYGTLKLTVLLLFGLNCLDVFSHEIGATDLC